MPSIHDFHSGIDDTGVQLEACAPVLIVQNVDPSGTVYVTSQQLYQVDIANGYLTNPGGVALAVGPGETLTLPIDSMQPLWLYSEVVNGSGPGYFVRVLYYG